MTLAPGRVRGLLVGLRGILASKAVNRGTGVPGRGTRISVWGTEDVSARCRSAILIESGPVGGRGHEQENEKHHTAEERDQVSRYNSPLKFPSCSRRTQSAMFGTKVPSQ